MQALHNADFSQQAGTAGVQLERTEIEEGQDESTGTTARGSIAFVDRG